MFCIDQISFNFLHGKQAIKHGLIRMNMPNMQHWATRVPNANLYIFGLQYVVIGLLELYALYVTFG